jgi:signal peptidase I
VDLLSQSLAQAQPNTADFINNLARTPLSKVVIFIVILSVLRMAMAPMLRDTPAHKRMGFYKVLRVANELFDALVYAGALVFLIIRPFAIQTFRIPSGSMWPTLHVYDFIIANKAIYRYTDPKFGDVVVFEPPVEGTIGHPEQVDPDGEVNVDFIKRLIGLPGDVIELRSGVLYRNGQAVADHFKHFSDCIKTDENHNCEEFRELSPDELSRVPQPSFKLVNYNGAIIPFNYSNLEGNSPSGQPYAVAPKFQVDDTTTQLKLIQQPPQKIPPGYYLFMGDNRNGSFDSRGWGLVQRDHIIGRSEFIWMPFSRLGTTR